jgi:hypothetical protein
LPKQARCVRCAARVEVTHRHSSGIEFRRQRTGIPDRPRAEASDAWCESPSIESSRQFHEAPLSPADVQFRNAESDVQRR